MTPHFTLAEFTASQIAARRGIANTLPPDLAPAAQQTLAMLERIRAYLSRVAGRDIPISISSGYRCPDLNTLVGGSRTSDHVRAAAADWTAPTFGPPVEICRALAPVMAELQIGQLIHEFGQWVHTSWRMPLQPINRVITISRAGTVPGVVEA